jgi:hypothetical protein
VIAPRSLLFPVPALFDVESEFVLIVIVAIT